MIETLLNLLPAHVQPFFYRTADGAEIDLLLEIAPNKLWAIEIKASHTPKLERGFHSACEDLPCEEKFVIYAGEQDFPMKDDVIATSLNSMIDRLSALS